MSPPSNRLGGKQALSINQSFRKKKNSFPYKMSGAGSKKSSSQSNSNDPFKVMSKLSIVNESDGEKGGVSALRRRLPPRRDPTLYEMAEYL
jgi:hypothetical protein